MHDNEYLARLDELLKDIEVQATQLEKNSSILQEVNGLKSTIEELVYTINEKTNAIQVSQASLDDSVDEFHKLESKINDVVRYINKELDENISKSNTAIEAFVSEVKNQSELLNISVDDKFTSISSKFVNQIELVFEKQASSLDELTRDNKEVSLRNELAVEKINSFSNRLNDLVSNDSLSSILKDNFNDRIEIVLRRLDELITTSSTQSDVLSENTELFKEISVSLSNLENDIRNNKNYLEKTQEDVNAVVQKQDNLEVNIKSSDTEMTRLLKQYVRFTAVGFVVTWALLLVTFLYK